MMNNDISDSASKPYDNTKAAVEIGGNLLTQSNGQIPKPQKMGWVGMIISIFIIGAIAHFAGCDDSSQPLMGEAHSGVTKAQWRQKALPFYNPGGGIRLTTVANFKKVMGELGLPMLGVE